MSILSDFSCCNRETEISVKMLSNSGQYWNSFRFYSYASQWLPKTPYTVGSQEEIYTLSTVTGSSHVKYERSS